MPGAPTEISNGLVPAGIVAAAITGFYLYVRRRFPRHNGEAIQGVVVLIAVAFLILTLTGVWFRGSGMALAWPWNL